MKAEDDKYVTLWKALEQKNDMELLLVYVSKFQYILVVPNVRGIAASTQTLSIGKKWVHLESDHSPLLRPQTTMRTPRWKSKRIKKN